jgi:hypothetical protein
LCFTSDGGGLPKPQKPIEKILSNELPTSYRISTIIIIIIIIVAVKGTVAFVLLLLLLFLLLIVGQNKIAGWRLFPIMLLEVGC